MMKKIKNHINKVAEEMWPISTWYESRYLAIYYFIFMILCPVYALITPAIQLFNTNPSIFWELAKHPIAISAYRISIVTAFYAAIINGIFGFLTAWVLARFKFFGRNVLDTFIDLPFALPTAVAGLTLMTVYNPEGPLGPLLSKLGIQIIFSRLGVFMAMLFVSLPFVVRTVQGVLQGIDDSIEEVAWSLGASPRDTLQYVLLPSLFPAFISGITLAWARSIGEFGSIIIISSNSPFKDLIAPVLIFQHLEQYNYIGASVVGSVLLFFSTILIVSVRLLAAYLQKFSIKNTYKSW
uniref:Sulfate transport system permease protein CysT n=1 Tax=Stichococcus bacillaris TaxID=37433 RepID=A0A097KKD9_9CHLO|nr:probable transport protein [Stichococcus bacillaris]AIT93648.1 probable transport protein [Stichococcus bacillaris]|mmetsp:Transcript_10845/g.32523  ORF Transcript_10845/g.32523 Transcript_10845/m.32523 type:complete len:295 (+) Transcript_10845:195-1079(+)